MRNSEAAPFIGPLFNIFNYFFFTEVTEMGPRHEDTC